MSKKKTTEEFIADAIRRHGDKYDYSLVKYTNATSNVIIICPLHGEFQQKAADHTNGSGCPECSKIQRRNSQTKGKDKFIKDAKVLWGEKYDYSKVEYTNNHTKVVITCPTHGDFTQQPSDHLSGHGCPLCSVDKHKRKLFSGVTNNLYNVKNERSYIVWSNLLLRTFDNPVREKLPTYKDCEICEEWKNYENFKKWYDDPANGYIEGYDLDKDLLSDGKKIYSPETCCFLPKHLNFLLRNKSKRDNLPNGVSKNGKGYRSCFTYYGKRQYKQYSTIKDAEKEYKRLKSIAIKDEAERLYANNLITERVYQGLIKYTLENLI